MSGLLVVSSTCFTIGPRARFDSCVVSALCQQRRWRAFPPRRYLTAVDQPPRRRHVAAHDATHGPLGRNPERRLGRQARPNCACRCRPGRRCALLPARHAAAVGRRGASPHVQTPDHKSPTGAVIAHAGQACGEMRFRRAARRSAETALPAPASGNSAAKQWPRRGASLPRSSTEIYGRIDIAVAAVMAVGAMKCQTEAPADIAAMIA